LSRSGRQRADVLFRPAAYQVSLAFDDREQKVDHPRALSYM